MPPTFLIRAATLEDVPVIARHRIMMFSDMGQLPDARRPELLERSVEYLRAALETGEYFGWLAAAEEPARPIVGGAGVQLRRTLPHPLTRDGETRIAVGRQAVVLNVYTESAWRRRGVAELLMRHVIEWAGNADLDTLVLHASDDGRHLYERLGFAQTNEMRFTAALRRG
jgi:ribosomal protein S18 acetylase RimI-like enzyme